MREQKTRNEWARGRWGRRQENGHTYKITYFIWDPALPFLSPSTVQMCMYSFSPLFFSRSLSLVPLCWLLHRRSINSIIISFDTEFLADAVKKFRLPLSTSSTQTVTFCEYLNRIPSSGCCVCAACTVYCALLIGGDVLRQVQIKMYTHIYTQISWMKYNHSSAIRCLFTSVEGFYFCLLLLLLLLLQPLLHVRLLSLFRYCMLAFCCCTFSLVGSLSFWFNVQISSSTFTVSILLQNGNNNSSTNHNNSDNEILFWLFYSSVDVNAGNSEKCVCVCFISLQTAAAAATTIRTPVE